MSELVGSGSKYSDQQRMDVAVLYAISGNATKVAKDTGIPRTTIVGWKKTDWWDDAVTRVRREKADEHRARYSEILSLAQDRTIEALPDATAQQAAVIGGVAFDKLRLIDNQATSISGKAESMTQLAQEFRRLSEQWEEKQVNVVETQDKTEEIE